MTAPSPSNSNQASTSAKKPDSSGPSVDPVIASKVEQIKALPYATNIVSEDVIERNFGYKIIRQQVSTGRNTMIYKCESVRYPESYCLVKPYKQGKDKIKSALREEVCQIMRFVSAKCQQIISTYDLYYTSEKLYIMTDWSQKGELIAAMKSRSIRVTEEVVRNWTTDILSAVSFLHNNAICHRNIAPSCLLLTGDNRVKIGILSDACIYCKPDGSLMKQKWEKFSRESNWNQAPEVAKKKPFDPRRADIWSIGATVFWLVCRTHPIDYRSSSRLTKQMDFRMSFLKKLSRRGQAFVKKMLTFQPPLRPTIQQAMELEWVSGSTSPAKPKAGSTGGSPSQASTSASKTQNAQQPAAAAAAAAAPGAANHVETTEVSQKDMPAEPGEATGPEENGAAGSAEAENTNEA